MGRALADAGFSLKGLELLYTPKSTVDITEDGEEAFVDFLEALEDQEDVQNVFHNAAD